jgi:uroporphyrinogen-III synthase
MPLLRADGGLQGQAAAIGPGTAQALQSEGVAEVMVAPEGHDSEALAGLQAVQHVAGKRVVLIRGVGGREFLAEVLRGRGAQLQVIECYRRLPPEGSLDEKLAVWQRSRDKAWSATSAEIVDNLFALAGEAGSAMLRSQVLLVPHARIAARAFLCGVRRILVTGPGDAGMVTGLKTWFGGLRNMNRQTT